MEFVGEQPVKIEEIGFSRYKVFLPMKEKHNCSIRLLDRKAGAAKSIGWQRSYPNEYRLSSQTAEVIDGLNGQDTDPFQRKNEWAFRCLPA